MLTFFVSKLNFPMIEAESTTQIPVIDDYYFINYSHRKYTHEMCQCLSLSDPTDFIYV